LALASDGGLDYAFAENRIVNPGEQGKIIGIYSTKREGPVNGSISVHHNGSSKNTILRLKGNTIVNPNQKTIGSYKNLSAAKIQFDRVFIEKNHELAEQITVEFTFKNIGETPLKLNKITATDGGIITYQPLSTPSGKTGVIRCTYTSNRLGPFNRSIVVYPEGDPTPIILKFTGVIF
jgi:hypothetical protein